MQWKVAHRVALAFLLACHCLSLEAEAESAMASSLGLFDTGTSSSAPISGDALEKKSGWIRLPEDQTAHRFTGDAVLSNGRLTVVLRRNAPGAEVYSDGEGGPTLRTLLVPTAGGGEVRLASVAVAENDAGAVAARATFTGGEAEDLQLRYELAVGQVFVKTEARGGVSGLRVEAPCRFVVLPDFFADDIVVDATEIPVPQAELPGENFLLQMLPDKDGIVVSVWNSGEADVRITLSGRGTRRVVDQGELRYGKDGTIWVAVISGRDVWHCREIQDDAAGEVIRLDWSMPYPAQWRVDWRRADRLTGSWEMIAQRSGGDFEKHGWFGDPTTIPRDRKRWTTVLGRFEYPCWVDEKGRGYLQPLKLRRGEVRFQGPALIYPINRMRTTPLERFTVVDVMRGTLGVGPCEYILDVEGQGAAMKGRATCAARDALKAIYASRKQKHRRAEIERILQDVVLFVTHIRGRIDHYVDFGRTMLAYVNEQEKAHPELAEFLAEMKSLTRAIDAAVRQREEQIQTARYVVDLTERFRRELVDYEGSDALAKCAEITDRIVTVGGNQDELVGECRMAVKVLRQRAGLAMAIDPRTAEVAKEIRRRTQEVLRNPASYEAPRH